MAVSARVADDPRDIEDFLTVDRTTYAFRRMRSGRLRICEAYMTYTQTSGGLTKLGPVVRRTGAALLRWGMTRSDLAMGRRLGRRVR